MYRQFRLTSDGHHVTCWLKCDGSDGAKLKPGVSLTLKHEPGRWWIVESVDGPIQREPPTKFWKVGGLG